MEDGPPTMPMQLAGVAVTTLIPQASLLVRLTTYQYWEAAQGGQLRTPLFRRCPGHPGGLRSMGAASRHCVRDRGASETRSAADCAKSRRRNSTARDRRVGPMRLSPAGAMTPGSPRPIWCSTLTPAAYAGIAFTKQLARAGSPHRLGPSATRWTTPL
jgi:hypothetical protein